MVFFGKIIGMGAALGIPRLMTGMLYNSVPIEDQRSRLRASKYFA